MTRIIDNLIHFGIACLLILTALWTLVLLWTVVPTSGRIGILASPLIALALAWLWLRIHDRRLIRSWLRYTEFPALWR